MRYAEVYLHRQMVPVGGLAGHTAVVFDVLRASTTAAQALHAGADCLVPFADIEEMRRFQEGLPEDVVGRSTRCSTVSSRRSMSAENLVMWSTIPAACVSNLRSDALRDCTVDSS